MISAGQNSQKAACGSQRTDQFLNTGRAIRICAQSLGYRWKGRIKSFGTG